MISISRTVKERPPVGEAFFDNATNIVLGKKYELSLVFVGDKRSAKLNMVHRNIPKPTDILSFELSKSEGEIYINLRKAKQKSKHFERTYENYLRYLFIHGLCHLKGMDHGSRMEGQEKKYCQLLNI